MAKKIIMIFIAIIAGLFVYAGFQPATYTISRSVHINATVDKVFPYLNNPSLSDDWAPWKAEDPQMTIKHEGPSEGVDAKSVWQSPGKMGHGSATIVAVQPMQKVDIKIQYTKPMVMEQDSEYIIEPATENSVNVTWKVHGTQNIMARVISLFMDMDKMVGGMFEKGLANLKTVAEKQ